MRRDRRTCRANYWRSTEITASRPTACQNAFKNLCTVHVLNHSRLYLNELTVRQCCNHTPSKRSWKTDSEHNYVCTPFMAGIKPSSAFVYSLNASAAFPLPSASTAAFTMGMDSRKRALAADTPESTGEAFAAAGGCATVSGTGTSSLASPPSIEPIALGRARFLLPRFMVKGWEGTDVGYGYPLDLLNSISFQLLVLCQSAPPSNSTVQSNGFHSFKNDSTCSVAATIGRQ